MADEEFTKDDVKNIYALASLRQAKIKDKEAQIYTGEIFKPTDLIKSALEAGYDREVFKAAIKDYQVNNLSLEEKIAINPHYLRDEKRKKRAEFFTRHKKLAAITLSALVLAAASVPIGNQIKKYSDMRESQINKISEDSEYLNNLVTDPYFKSHINVMLVKYFLDHKLCPYSYEEVSPLVDSFELSKRESKYELMDSMTILDYLRKNTHGELGDLISNTSQFMAHLYKKEYTPTQALEILESSKKKFSNESDKPNNNRFVYSAIQEMYLNK